MRIVTISTLSLLKRQMLNVATGLQVRPFVTLVAEAAVFFCGGERDLRVGRIVAFLTLNFDCCRVSARFQQLGLQR